MAGRHRLNLSAEYWMPPVIVLAGLLVVPACSEGVERAPVVTRGGTVELANSARADSEEALASLGSQADSAVAEYLALVAAHRSQPDIEKTCALVRSAQRLVPLLVGSLEKQNAAVLSMTGGNVASGSGARTWNALSTQIEQADEILVGVGLRLGAENVYGYARYDEIADLDSVEFNAAQLLRAVAGAWRDPTGWPIYVDQQTDVSGCWNPGALIGPITEVASAWEGAPECLRNSVEGAIDLLVIDALSEVACYCVTRDQVLADVVRLVETAGSLGVSHARSRLDASLVYLRSDDAAFDCGEH